jgi:hypothetical protein
MITMTQTHKVMHIVRHDETTLPILKHMTAHDFMSIAISEGVIIWIYKGLSMLVPAARIQNMLRLMEAEEHNEGKTDSLAMQFRSDEAIKLPQQIANALLGDS